MLRGHTPLCLMPEPRPQKSRNVGSFQDVSKCAPDMATCSRHSEVRSIFTTAVVRLDRKDGNYCHVRKTNQQMVIDSQINKWFRVVIRERFQSKVENPIPAGGTAESISYRNILVLRHQNDRAVLSCRKQFGRIHPNATTNTLSRSGLKSDPYVASLNNRPCPIPQFAFPDSTTSKSRIWRFNISGESESFDWECVMTLLIQSVCSGIQTSSPDKCLISRR
jgi:hypothetical protein